MRLKSKFIAGVLCVLFLSSCSATKYEKNEHSWPNIYGYDEVPLDSNTYEVSFAGNTATSAEQCNRYALYRAAELAVAKGYQYFVVMDGQQSQRDYINSMPMGHTTTIEHTMDPQTGQMVPVAVTTGQSMVTTNTEHTITKTVRLFNGSRPDANPGAYDAKSMVETMAPYVNR